MLPRPQACDAVPPIRPAGNRVDTDPSDAGTHMVPEEPKRYSSLMATTMGTKMQFMAEESFVEIHRRGATALVREDAIGPVGDALFDHTGCTPLREAGRGTILRFTVPGGHGIVRRYLRGGMVRHLLKDRYLLANRPLHEFRLHRYVQTRGLRVPPILGVCWERRGLWVQGSLATLEVAGLELPAWLRREAGGAEQMLRRCGELIREMHDFGVLHADLQVKNIFVAEDGPYLLDFDNARRRANVPPQARGRNLLRLRRSFGRNGVVPACFDAICEGYGMDRLPPRFAGVPVETGDTGVIKGPQ